MLAERFITYLSVLALVAAPLTSRAPCDCETGDANGDRAVNIHDIQTIISHILHGTHPQNHGDINRDGRIDVLDFQFVLVQAIQSTEHKEEPPPDKTSQKAVPTKHHGIAIGSLETRPAVPFVTLHEGRDLLPHLTAPLLIFSSRTERYRFNLTPHAPPLQ